MWKRSAKISPVNGAVSGRFWRIEVFASWTVELNSFLIGDIGQTNRKEGMGETKNAGTSTKVGFLVFLKLKGHGCW
jgi:hypothetical protein